MIFTIEQIRGIKQRKITAALTVASEPLEPGQLRELRRWSTTADGQRRPELVSEQIDGERVSSIVTILAVRQVQLEELTTADARACGWRTVTGLREWWRSEHPRAGAQLVHFALGDVRDLPRLLAPSGSGSDYTHTPAQAMRGSADAGEALSRPEQDAISTIARQRDVQNRAARAEELAKQSASGRLASIRVSSRR